jgi:tetratricopeptide (TPR) repeat protein
LSRLPDALSVSEPWTVAANCYLAEGNTLTGHRARAEYRTAVNLANRSIEITKASRLAYGYRQRAAEPIGPAAADSNRIIAAASLRLDQPDAALQSALKARAIEPNNPQTCRQIAEVYLGQQKAEEAAITLAEGAFATGSEELRGDLIRLYQQTDLDTRKCAVVAGPRGPALNPNCEIVHRDLCQATTRAHRLDLRRQLSCSN